MPCSPAARSAASSHDMAFALGSLPISVILSHPSSMALENGTVEKTENLTRIFFSAPFQRLAAPEFAPEGRGSNLCEQTIHFRSGLSLPFVTCDSPDSPVNPA